MSYYLMNKNKLVLEFEIITYRGSTYVEVLGTYGDKPFDCDVEYVEEWLMERYAAKHRLIITDILGTSLSNDLRTLIEVVHCTSINDTFWVKEKGSVLTWKDVSLYSNEFNEVVSRASFIGDEDVCKLEIDSHTGEASTGGMYKKRWRREDGVLYMYKRGDETDNRTKGLEPYCEVLGSEVAGMLDAGIQYSLSELHSKLASKCRIFTDEKIGYTPISAFIKRGSNLQKITEFYYNLGQEEEFSRMLVSDAIILNSDRHMGNYGVLFDCDTMQILGKDPGYDFNRSMLFKHADAVTGDIEQIINCYKFRFSGSAVVIARAYLTDSIRASLRNMLGFKFTFEGDDIFTKEHVNFVNHICNQQIRNILNEGQIVYIDKTHLSYKADDFKKYPNVLRHLERSMFTEDLYTDEINRLYKVYKVSTLDALDKCLAPEEKPRLSDAPVMKEYAGRFHGGDMNAAMDEIKNVCRVNKIRNYNEVLDYIIGLLK